MSEPKSLRIAVVLYRPDEGGARRLLDSVDVAVRRARAAGVVSDVQLRLGDCTLPTAMIMEKPIVEDALGDRFLHDHREVGGSYDAFGANLWHSGGVNRLLGDLTEDVALLLNPDLVVGPDSVELLVGAVDDTRVAIADARQLPFEHPKPHDPATGDAPWASMAACALRREAWEDVGPLDEAWFPMHGNDVDFSWRARLAGWRVRHVPAARVFHDKRLGPGGAVVPSEVEAEHGARAAVLLAVKYSRPDVAERHLSMLEAGTTGQRRGAAAARELLAHGRLPALLDAGHEVAEFVAGDFARHRF
ncbi:MAG TPA: glycosyltransferase family 2 protein [Mycobacteriales bacterium]|nr:glycosyltransferase family 2 protein [Mycobacteriales bacterium]